MCHNGRLEDGMPLYGKPTYQAQSGQVIPNETVASSSCDEQRDYGHAALAVMR
jgi:hypothetical protein